MAEQVAYTSFSQFPRAPYQPQYEVAWHVSPETASMCQEWPFAQRASGGDGYAKDIVRQIIDDHQFSTFFVSVRAVLQLDQSSWRAYLLVRDDPTVRRFLEPAQPAIWHVPPDTIWQLVVKLRQSSVFPDLQADILIEVEDAYRQAHPQHALPQTRTRRKDRFNSVLAATASKCNTPVPSDVTMDAQNGTVDTAQVLHPKSTCGGQSAPLPPSRKCVSSKSSDKLSNTGARQAPEGWLYYCPSRGCSKKPYKRLGHYEKHLKGTHPDFGPRHPHHSAQMSLKPRVLGTSWAGQSKDHVHGVNRLAASRNTNHSALRSSLASRRDSCVSLSSLNSTAVSSSVFDEVPEPAIYATPDLTVADASVLQDHSVWHTGGGAMMDDVNVDTLGGFYTRLDRG